MTRHTVAWHDRDIELWKQSTMADKEENLVRLAVYVSEEKRARFKAACAIQRISMNQVIGDFLDEWLKQNEKPPALASTGGNGKRKEKNDKPTTTG